MVERRPWAPLLAGLLLSLASCDARQGEPTHIDLPPEDPSGPPFFEDVTNSSGLSHTYRNGEETADHLAILESLGGGVALLDYDGDGRLDVFLTGGGHYAGADLRDVVGLPCRLFRNLGAGRFRDVTAEVGLDKLAGDQSWFYSHGTAVADYDRDGWPDLLVTGWGRLALFHNVPVDPKDAAKGRRFEDVTAAAGLGRGITWATSAAFGDLDGDGYPDLYVCQYVNWSLDNNPKCGFDGKRLDVCPPRNFDGLPHKVYRNTGRGQFVDVSAAAGLVAAEHDSCKGLGVLLIDVDGDGKPDVYVANDAVDKQALSQPLETGEHPLRGGRQEQRRRPRRHGPCQRQHGRGRRRLRRQRPAGAVGHQLRERAARPVPQRIRPGVTFFNSRRSRPASPRAARSTSAGARPSRRGPGRLEDLFVANGHAVRYHSETGAGRLQPPVLYRNLGGKFRDVSRRIGSYREKNHLARGVGFGDLDNDGRTDLVISHVNEPVTILRGIGGQGRHWLGVQLIGQGHADVVGARAQLQVGERTLTRFAKGAARICRRATGAPLRPGRREHAGPADRHLASMGRNRSATG